MLEFTEENIDWLEKLIKQSIDKTNDELKKGKLNQLLNKISRLGEFKLKTSIEEKDLLEINNVIEDLEGLTLQYSNLHDISALEEYDKLKKTFSAKLQYLSTYKDILCDEVNYLDSTLRKEIRISIALNIKEEEGVSFTQADKMVEKDKRYTILRDQVDYVERIANKIKTKYSFYMQLWQMIFQNVSTASKERYASNNNND